MEKLSSAASSAQWFARLCASVWLFPLIITIALLLLTVFKISGSSMGIYNTLLYGGGKKDSSLLFNKPREIRSDEWVVNTQMTIAQKNNHFARINHNIGQGQDMSVVLDVPYAEWSQIFKPHNLAFFVLPLEFAFALKWWLMAWLLIISCYFFVLSLLPGRRLLAAGISLSLLCGGMIQWWYQ
ncbi:MAG TPA: hypothetical protein VGO07_00250, partial [Candidatus Saccharimonadales bacterium]|nr:hypothetical protein [Candidatus Saccharimonadales bacterium]